MGKKDKVIGIALVAIMVISVFMPALAIATSDIAEVISSDKTEVKEICGTPMYNDPEYLRNKVTYIKENFYETFNVTAPLEEKEMLLASNYTANIAVDSNALSNQNITVSVEDVAVSPVNKLVTTHSLISGIFKEERPISFTENNNIPNVEITDFEELESVNESATNITIDIESYQEEIPTSEFTLSASKCDFKWYGKGVWSSKSEYSKNEKFIDYAQFANYGIDSSYTVYFYLYDPSGKLIGQSSKISTLKKGYYVKWTVKYNPPGSGWKTGKYKFCAKVKPDKCSELSKKCCYNKVSGGETKPSPKITKVNHPSSITLGEWAEIYVKVKNEGEEANWQTIAVSFPQNPKYGNIKIVKHDLDSAKVFKVGEEVWAGYGTKKVKLKYPLVEGSSSPWKKWEDEYHQLLQPFILRTKKISAF